MQTSQKGVDFIKSFEGLSLTAYKAVPTERYWTIGYGHYGSDVVQGMTITAEQAEDIMKNELVIYEDGVNNNVTVELNQNQFDALVSFAYNCGVGALKTSTLLELLNKGDYVGASNEFPKWNKSGGKVLNGLVRRRASERAMFLESIPVPKDDPYAYGGTAFKKGSEGEQVKMIQRALNNAVGKQIVPVTGYYGDITTKEVKNYQKRHGLEVDGIVGKITWSTLF